MAQLLSLLSTLLTHSRYLIIGSILILTAEIAGYTYIHTNLSSKTQNQESLVQSQNTSASATIASSSAKIATPSASPSAKPTATVAKKAEPAPKPVTAAAPAVAVSNNRLGWANNKYGMYSYKDPESVRLTAEVVNSNGGDWGWILFPINIKDYGVDSWNSMFNICRENHLIPIAQIIMDPGYVPSDDDVEKTADFYNQVKWPTQKKYVTAFNEVNAAEYWGNRIDPAEVAQKLNKFIDAFKARSPDFFLMNGALNASARTGKVLTNLGVQTEYLDEPNFLEQMNSAVPGIFRKLDGWAVHTYPQPEYKGKPLDTTIAGEADWERGRNTMSSYKWEQNILKSKFGVDLPIFITEMGWPHKEGAKPRAEWYDQNTVADYYKSVFRDLLVPDNRVVAVIPFGMKVTSLDNFSFVGNDGTRYPQFEAIKSLPKVTGNPPR